MSIASEITRLQNAKAALKTSIEGKGVTVSSSTTLDGYPALVDSIVQGGGELGSVYDDVVFYDYDGTAVKSYTAADFLNLTSLPDNPSHDGLTSQGWNWSLSDAKSYVTTYGKLNIGQMYVTDTGETRAYITVPKDGTTVNLNLKISGRVTIDWGDQTTEDSTSWTASINHTYSNPGDYIVKITVKSGTVNLGGGSSLALFGSLYDVNAVYRNVLRRVEVGNNAKIYEYAFSKCHSLSSITIPNTITSIESYAFQNAFGLKCIIIPNGVTTIKSNAFNMTRSLSAASLPNTLTSIASSAFRGSFCLNSFTIPSGVTVIQSSLFDSSYVKDIIIPNTVTTIYSYAFSGCNSLSTVVIPDSVTDIPSGLFSYSYSITTVTIPANVTSIGSTAFSNCYGLKSIYMLPTTPPNLTSGAFPNSNFIIYVPSGSLTDYQSASNWSSYSSQMRAM